MYVCVCRGGEFKAAAKSWKINYGQPGTAFVAIMKENWIELRDSPLRCKEVMALNISQMLFCNDLSGEVSQGTASLLNYAPSLPGTPGASFGNIPAALGLIMFVTLVLLPQIVRMRV